MNLAIVGYGKMGRLVERLAPEYGFSVKLRLDSKNNGNFEALTWESLQGADVAVEFSNPASAPQNVERLAAIGVNVVTGTTGWTSELAGLRSLVERSGTGLVWSPNFSVGVCLFSQIVSEAARLMGNQSDYEAWTWEIHHQAKKDAPSGTLLAVLEKMKTAGYARRVDMSSNRAGKHPGTHEIGFDSESDTIALRHTARNRDAFGRGALRAARWVIGKKGFYDFRHVLGQLE
jgi:4-hydroxy-tetrahydrodipicolinate reductase